MSPLEIFATVATVLCVLFAVKRWVWNYPIGIIGTIAFFFVFYGAGLYASAVLQIVFTAVQLYGWWYWLKGDRGNKPRIKRIGWPTAGILAFFIGGVSYAGGILTAGLLAPADAAVFGLSLLAQFFMDRKWVESWGIWALVNVISIPLYFSYGLTITAVLYIGLLLNTLWGNYEWQKELRSYD